MWLEQRLLFQVQDLVLEGIDDLNRMVNHWREETTLGLSFSVPNGGTYLGQADSAVEPTPLISAQISCCTYGTPGDGAIAPGVFLNPE